jgi:N-methylhydantoinase A
MSRVRVGVDVGGTFTDVVLLDDAGGLQRRKLLTTPDGFGRAVAAGIVEGLAHSAGSPSDVAEVVHGTTIATNTILERTGAPTGLITTRGFRDVLELRRIRSPELYNLFYVKPPPLVPRRHRLEVTGRVDAHGNVVTPLDETGVAAALDRLAGEGIRSVAVCMINAYVDGAMERRIREIAERWHPEVEISLSSEVLPEVREYERTSTTVINAYLRPVARRYFDGLVRDLRSAGVDTPLLVMQSNGGMMTARAAQERPIHVVESGPAAGVIAAALLATRGGYRNALSFDMGGTTAKASLIEDGEVARTAEYEVGAGISLTSRLVKGGGYALRTPVIDVAEVGAGGGSVVSVDAGGGLHVGPRSAGSVPGPVCYGRGGTEPTVSDANVVLGYLNPSHLVGGELAIDAEASRRAIHDRVAGPLGLSVEEAARGVHLVANSNMMRAVRAVSSQRGRDPRGFTLVAFGGSGPVHAVELARALETPRVVVPPAPGLFSAFGLLFAEHQHHYVRTYYRSTRELDLEAFEAARSELRTQAEATLREEGYAAPNVAMAWQADVRYSGQSFELTVPMLDTPAGPADIETLREAFAVEHQRTYGHRAGPDAPIELINLRLIATGLAQRARSIELAPIDAPTPASSRPAFFGADGWLETPVVGRADLGGSASNGPLIVEEYDATTVIPPGWRARLDPTGSIVIESK